nr:hypothetical protein B0A51_02814 [Rachicladosporium sp. CCFEE 5018]
MDAFQYSPLGADDNIRLLRVDGLSSDGSLLCSLIAVNRRKLPAGIAYTALSYRWGDPDDKGTLQIRNLDNATSCGDQYYRNSLPLATLEMLLDMYANGWIAKAWIWLDYLCLHQADTEEKNVQVRHMSSVYELAEKVIVYAGPELSHTGLAVVFWNKLHSVFESLPQRDEAGKWISISPGTILETTQTSWRGPEWQALLEHFLRPWFGRLWTIQEAVLPRHVIFVWGRFSLTWDEVRRFEDWERRASLCRLIGGGSRFWTVSKTIMSLCYLRSNRAGMSKGWQCTLADAISSCDGAEAADPRDRIYGLLGLLFGPDGDLGVRPDYSEYNTARDVYTEATRRFTLQRDSFDIMYFAGIGWPRKISELPSWVPDFSGALNGSPGTHLRAGKGPAPCIIKALESEGNNLTLQLIIVDRIAAIQDFSTAPESHLESHDIAPDPLAVWYLSTAIQVVCERHPTPWSTECIRAFWLTLMFNTTLNDDKSDGSSPMPASYGDAFASLEVVARSGVLPSAPVQQASQVDSDRLLACVMGRMSEHAISLLGNGEPALVPRMARTDDVIAVALCARAPFVLRPSGAVENDSDWDAKPALQISAPTNFRREDISIPGLTPEQQTFIRAKAKADAERMYMHLQPLQSSPSTNFAERPAPSLKPTFEQFTTPRPAPSPGLQHASTFSGLAGSRESTGERRGSFGGIGERVRAHGRKISEVVGSGKPAGYRELGSGVEMKGLMEAQGGEVRIGGESWGSDGEVGKGMAEGGRI